MGKIEMSNLPYITESGLQRHDGHVVELVLRSTRVSGMLYESAEEEGDFRVAYAKSKSRQSEIAVRNGNVIRVPAGKNFRTYKVWI